MSFDLPELRREAIKLFEHAVSLWPTSVDAHLDLASALHESGDVERAEKIYREVIENHPNEARALNDLAWILQEHYQRYDAALELTNKGLKVARDDLDLLDTRGTILTNLPNRLTDAKNDFAKLVELLPADTRERAKALLQLGRICAKLNDPAHARQHLQDALEIDRKVNVFTEAERSEIAGIVQRDSM